MAFYLDSALVYEARVARDLGWVSGITTNPILLVQSEISPEETLRALSTCTRGEIFYQLTAQDLESMHAEAWVANQLLGKQLVLKIPATPVGFQAAARHHRHQEPGPGVPAEGRLIGGRRVLPVEQVQHSTRADEIPRQPRR